MDMTKFAHLEDSGFIYFCERLRRWIEADLKASAWQYGEYNCQYNMFGKGEQRITGGHFLKRMEIRIFRRFCRCLQTGGTNENRLWDGYGVYGSAHGHAAG